MRGRKLVEHPLVGRLCDQEAEGQSVICENFADGSHDRACCLFSGCHSRDLSSQEALPAMFSLLDQVSWPSILGVFELGSEAIPGWIARMVMIAARQADANH
jgi:hypothetical protein